VLCATAGQEDPFELDASLLLSSGRHGIVVRGSTLYNHETPLLGDLADLLYCGIALFVEKLNIAKSVYFYLKIK
jgi:hypothetical protein